MKGSVYIATSLDGFIARENGDIDWLPAGEGGTEEEEEDYGYHDFMESVDVVVMGRHSYEKVLSFALSQWPYGRKRVVVLSSQGVDIPSDIAGTVETRSCTPLALVNDLAERGAKHIYVDGGRTIQGFLQAGLIEQLIITTIPILLGSGIPLFGPLAEEVQLQHMETRAFASGLVQSRYRVLGL